MSSSDASLSKASATSTQSTHADTPDHRPAPPAAAMLTFHSLALHPLARRLTACCQSLHRQGFTPGTFACLSAREEGLRWITPQNVSFGSSQPGQFIVSWPDERTRLAAPGLAFPSIQAALHDALYTARPDCLAIIQAPLPPTFLSAFQASAHAADVSTFPLPVIGFETPLRIAIAPVQPTGELPADLLPLTATHEVIITRTHGVLILGVAPEAAVATLEQVHWISQSILLAS